MQLNDFLILQKNNIKDQFVNKMAECLVSTTRERIERHAKEFGWKLGYINGTNINKVITIQKEKSNFTELWVSSTYTKYRSAFRKYLEEYYSIDENLPEKFHVDHILPISRFGKKYPNYFIRLFLLDRKINCSYGACFEKIENKYESKKEPQGGFHLNEIALLKLYGIKVPPKSSDHIERNDWAICTAKTLEKEGFEEWEINYPILLSGLYSGYRNLNLIKTIKNQIGVYDFHQEFT